MNQIRTGSNNLEGKILINNLKPFFEANIEEIYKNITDNVDSLVPEAEGIFCIMDEGDYLELHIFVLSDNNVVIITDRPTYQEQVILNTSNFRGSVTSHQHLYDLLTKSSINVFKCIYKNKVVDEVVCNYVLAVDPSTERDIKMRCLSLILDASIEDLLSNEIAMEGEYDLRKFLLIKDEKTAVLLYDPTRNRMCVDIQLNDCRETFIFTFKSENVDISVNTLAYILINAVVSDYLSEDFGLVYTLDDRLE